MGYSNDITRPKFAIMNPVRTYTLPSYQTVAGVTDMIMHTMERFYHAIGMPINIHELIGRDITDDEIKEMARKCNRDYKSTQGCFKVLNHIDMETIYQMAK